VAFAFNIASRPADITQYPQFGQRAPDDQCVSRLPRDHRQLSFRIRLDTTLVGAILVAPTA